MNVIKKIVFIIIILTTNLKLSAQSNSELHERVKLNNLLAVGEEDNAFFNSFTGGIGALFNKNQGGASIDLSSLTIKYFIPLGIKNDSVNVQREDGTIIPNRLRQRYRGVDLYLINRATMNIDSLNSIANDYLTSLQASPITVRLGYEGYLTKNREINVNQILPVVKYRFTGDARAVPYNSNTGDVELGGSGNFYFSLLTQFRGIQIDGGEIKDQGTFYIEPSIGFAYGSQELMESIFKNGKSKVLFSSELRFGYTSDYHRIKDWGILARYTWEDVTGPNFRIGFNITPNN
jgi:hypothetical protein